MDEVRDRPVAKKANTKLIGDKSEAQVFARFVDADLTVLLPFGENVRYDLVVDVGKKLQRVQVKTGRIRDGGIVFGLRSGSQYVYEKYTSEQIDWYAVYEPTGREIYLLPVEDAGWLRLHPPRNNQSKKVRLCTDYTFDTRLAEFVSGR